MDGLPIGNSRIMLGRVECGRSALDSESLWRGVMRVYWNETVTPATISPLPLSNGLPRLSLQSGPGL